MSPFAVDFGMRTGDNEEFILVQIPELALLDVNIQNCLDVGLNVLSSLCLVQGLLQSPETKVVACNLQIG